MTAVILVLRALHIVGAVFWAGSTWALYGFVLPAARATQPDSRRFVQHLATASGLSAAMTIAALAATVGGVALFVPATGQLDPGLMRSGRGVALGLGALLGLAALGESLAVSRPTAQRLGALSAAIEAGGAPPTPAQAQQLEAQQAKLMRTGRRAMVLLGLAALLMAIARYL